MRSHAIIRVEHAGSGLSIQDAGRPGWMRFGVPPGGAMDPSAALHANRLVGNPPNTPLLEIYRLGARLRLLADATIALTGSESFQNLPGWRTHRLEKNALLAATGDCAGSWAYLAIPGGFKARKWLSSSSTNPRARFGSFLTAGDELCAEGDPNPVLAGIASRYSAPEIVRDYSRPPALAVHVGPQARNFDRRDRKTFFETEWIISRDSDRVGYRLEGDFIEAPPDDLLSEPVLPGSIQIPPGGQPLITMPDGPTVGGYHKLGIIEPTELFWLAQAKPGQAIRFRPAEEMEPVSSSAQE